MSENTCTFPGKQKVWSPHSILQSEASCRRAATRYRPSRRWDRVYCGWQSKMPAWLSISPAASRKRYTRTWERKYTLGAGRSTELSWIVFAVPSLDGVVQIACGQNHSLALTNDGKIFGWGCNKFRQLADNEALTLNRPTLIYESRSTDIKLLCGWTHSAILDRMSIQLVKICNCVTLMNNLLIIFTFTNCLVVILKSLVFPVTNWRMRQVDQLGKEFVLSIRHPGIALGAAAHIRFQAIQRRGIWFWTLPRHYRLGNNDTFVVPCLLILVRSGWGHMFRSMLKFPFSVDNELVSWGWNEHGSCGNGDYDVGDKPTYLKINNVSQIGAGTGQSFAVVA